MISKFFIDRPVLSWVIALLTLLLGLICLPNMEIARYPNIAPPSVRVTFTYSGASAETMENTVAQVVEQQMTGLDHLLYFSSSANSEGSLTLSFSFDPSVDPDVAQMQIQNRLDTIMNKLPDAVQRNGVRVRKVSDDTLLTIAFYARDGSMGQEDVADFVSSVLQDPISRINGVGNVTLHGSEYAIRIWLNHDKLFAYSLTPEDVVDAVEAQNKQVSVGQLGGLPNVEGQPVNVNVQSRRLLERVEDFAHILVKVQSDGSAVYVSDVADVQMGRESYTYSGNYNGRPMASLTINLTEGANAVDTAARVEQMLIEMRPLFPDNLTYAYSYDTVPFVKASLFEVSKTLVEALLLVSAVIWLFLRDMRSTLIVCITIPVVLSAAGCVLYVLGYSINTLTMFAMVLAIGLLVDDAIVVVENINRLMLTENLSPKEAAKVSMEEISSALFGVGLVIAAVFTPMGFFSGAVGNIYRQFSVTIVSSMLFSVAVAIMITPSLCAQLLRPRQHKGYVIGDIFDRLYKSSKRGYLHLSAAALHSRRLTMLLLVAITAAAAGLFAFIPTSFLPTEDQGMISARIVLPSGSTQAMTQKTAMEVEDFFLIGEKRNVQGFQLTLGSGGGRTSGQGTAQGLIRLTDWSERTDSDSSAFAILDRARRHFANYPDAKIQFSLPPSIRGLGSASGFQVQILNSSGQEHERFMQDIRQIVAEANQNPLLYNVRYEVQEDAAQLQINIDDLRAGQFGVDPDDVNENLSTAWGGSYVNDFIDRGRAKKVYVQAAPEFRSVPSDLSKLYFRNSSGQMVSFDSIGSWDWTYGPVQLERFNGVSSIAVMGDPAPGISSGQAMAEIVRIINDHPGHYGYGWSGASYQEVQSGQQSLYLFALSAVIVFLCLAALYESWTIPLAVMMIVPVGVAGALTAVLLRSMSNDVYLQIGLLTTGGLAAKNAILIVEYARHFRLQGMTLLKAASKAAAMRYRPIVMTSIAFLLGVLPLAVSDGAGAQSQQSIGTGVIGGTLAATTLGLVMVPVFFVTVSIIFDKKLRRRLRR